MHNLPVITDPNIPTNLGTGSNQDAIYVLRSSDIVLFESGVRAEAFREPLAAQMSVLLQVSSYIAFVSRYANSIVEISGFTPPTWGKLVARCVAGQPLSAAPHSFARYSERKEILDA